MFLFDTHYSLGSAPVIGLGLGVLPTQLDLALSGPVGELVFDDAGNNIIKALIGSVADTDFAQHNLELLLSREGIPEDWRVGEALAEYYLTACKSCHFPWPDGRDERKRGSSLPGADLVGFKNDGDMSYFVFGEVKTSAEQVYPPNVFYGRHGLKQQLEDLRDKYSIRDDLVKYLAFRAVNSTWQSLFQSAARVYLQNKNDVRIFGLLVRDVPPHEDDLRARLTKLGQNCPTSTVIELIALYLPQGSIRTLGSQVVACRSNGGAP